MTPCERGYSDRMDLVAQTLTLAHVIITYA